MQSEEEAEEEGGEGTPEDYRKEENTDEKSFTSMCSSRGAEAMSPRRWS